MKIRYLSAPVMLAALLAAGCASMGGTQTAQSNNQQQAFERAYTAAIAAVKKAAAVDNEWSPTDKLLKNAHKAAKAGDYAKAIKLADKAKFQGDMAYQQYLSQRNAGPHF